MDRNQKILTTGLWSFLILVMIGVVGTALWAHRRDEDAQQENRLAASQQAEAVAAPAQRKRLERLYPVPAFSLTDQNGSTVTNGSLLGRPWVAAFIFTNCAGDCPMMSRRLKAIQEATKGTPLRLVSFTVDPNRDTREVLKKYAADLGADESRWMFLRGTEEQMQRAARDMKISAQPATENTPIIHGDWLLLVDGEGFVRGAYRSKDEDSQKQLAADALALAGRPGGRAP